MYVYIFMACNVCLFVYNVVVRTAEPIGPNFLRKILEG